MSTKREADEAFIASLAAEIHARRSYLRMTQQEVWEEAGISKSAYIKLENAKPGTARKIDDLRRVAEALELSLTDLMGKVEAGMQNFHGDGRLPKGITRAEANKLAERMSQRRGSSASQPQPRKKRQRETGS